MANKFKGFYKSFKSISQIFVVKEREMEIGYPTDVKHVAHIGWDGSSGSAPGWMSEFKAGPEVSSPSSSWPIFEDYNQSPKHRPLMEMIKDIPSRDVLSIPKRRKRTKKPSSDSSPTLRSRICLQT